MVGFYIIIAMWAWFYPGQPEQEIMLVCNISVAEALAQEGAAEEAASHLVSGLF